MVISGPYSYRHYCLNSGQCRSLARSETMLCLCRPGYSGERCEKRELHILEVRRSTEHTGRGSGGLSSSYTGTPYDVLEREKRETEEEWQRRRRHIMESWRNFLRRN